MHICRHAVLLLIPAPRELVKMASANEMLCCNMQVHHRSPTTRCRTAPPMSLHIPMGCPQGAHQGTGQQVFPRASIRCPRRGSSPQRPQAPCPTTWVGVLDRLACHHILGYPHLDPCLGRCRISGQVKFVVGVSGSYISLKAVAYHQSGCCGHQHICLFVTSVLSCIQSLFMHALEIFTQSHEHNTLFCQLAAYTICHCNQ